MHIFGQSIAEGKVVELKYVLTNSKGEELDRAEKGDGFFYLHGHNNIIPGLEAALLGCNVGDSKKVTIPPEEAYGMPNPDLRMKVPKSQFPPNFQLAIGQEFVAEIGDAHVPFVVHDIQGEEVFVDGNHPLAGETLTFEVEVLSLRDATKEEVEHGHVHGPGGHHHH